MGVVRGVATLHDHMMYMVILVMYDHFHGIKSLFCPMEHKFPAVNKKCPQNLLSKPVPVYSAQEWMEHACSVLLSQVGRAIWAPSAFNLDSFRCSQSRGWGSFDFEHDSNFQAKMLSRYTWRSDVNFFFF